MRMEAFSVIENYQSNEMFKSKIFSFTYEKINKEPEAINFPLKWALRVYSQWVIVCVYSIILIF